MEHWGGPATSAQDEDLSEYGERRRLITYDPAEGPLDEQLL